MPDNNSTILALDIGDRRIGVAAANTMARLPHPLITIENSSDTLTALQELVNEQQAVGIVVGLPRNLNGNETEQTQIIRKFVEFLKAHIATPIYWQDEAVTSRQAEKELAARGKPYAKGDIDALAATYILEDFLHEHPEVTA